MAAEHDSQVLLEFLEIAIDLAKGIAWPVMVFLLSFLFRHEIRQLARRIIQVGPNVIHLGRAEQDTAPLEHGFSSSFGSSLKPLHDENAKHLENMYRERYEAMQGPKKLDHILRDLTLQTMDKHFAIAYSGIFGSQIRFMRDLNSRMVSRVEAEQYFLSLQSSNPALANWNVDMYMTFLLNWNLIEFDNVNYRISHTGKSFLHFLTEYNLSEYRIN